jgi:hypothetical protein
MIKNCKVLDEVVKLFDSIPAESLTHHLNKATADMVTVNDFENNVERSNAVFTNSQLINFINNLNVIIKNGSSLPPVDQSQLN